MAVGYYALDLETAPVNEADAGFAALEPWRQRNGSAYILSADIIDPSGQMKQIVNKDHRSDDFRKQYRDLLRSLKGQVVWAHNAIFDVAWSIAILQPDRCGPIPQEVLDIDWRDTSLLMRWLINGQKVEKLRFSYSLANLVKVFLSEHEQAEEFVQMKAAGFQAGQNIQYWLDRAHLDVVMTQQIAVKYAPSMPVEMRKGFMTEQRCLVPVANSWINGIYINPDKLKTASDFYGNAKKRIAEELGVSQTMFSSPKQLGKFLFEDLGVAPVSRTKTGNPGTSKEDLVWIRHGLLSVNNTKAAEIIGKILEAKTSSTLMSKYVKTTYEALDHNGDGFIYGSPRLFGTYTGRMTYSNSTMKKHKIGPPLHQIPRTAKLVRDMLEPTAGFKIYEADASGQESRLMALRSGDPLMLEVFKTGMNFHSMTGSRIVTMDYDEFEAAREAEDDEGPITEQRQMGKLTNLSCNYRISGKALASQAFVKYGMYIDPATGNHLVSTFKSTYSMVPEYWNNVIAESRANGYTEAFGGRRFKLSQWSSDRWLTESSAISFPIQGAGASMKEIVISELHAKLPEFRFCLDLHDASFGYLPKEYAEELKVEADKICNEIDYEPYWGFKPEIDLPYDSKMGDSFKDVK